MSYIKEEGHKLNSSSLGMLLGLLAGRHTHLKEKIERNFAISLFSFIFSKTKI